MGELLFKKLSKSNSTSCFGCARYDVLFHFDNFLNTSHGIFAGIWPHKSYGRVVPNESRRVTRRLSSSRAVTSLSTVM